jgi:hypothetical protein
VVKCGAHLTINKRSHNYTGLQLQATQDSELLLSILLPPENKIRLMNMEAICNTLWLQIAADCQQALIGGG